MSHSIKQWLRRLTGSRYTVGVEVTDSAIHLVELMSTSAGPSLRNYRIEPLLHGTMDDGRILDPAGLFQALQSAVSKLDLKTRNVYFAIPSQTTMVRFLKLPDVSDPDMRKLIAFEIKHNIHLPFENPLFDFIKQDNRKLPVQVESGRSEAAAGLAADPLVSLLTGNQAKSTDTQEKQDEVPEALLADVMLVAAPEETIRFYMDWLTTCKLKPLSIEIKALSLYRLIEWSKPIDPESTFIIAEIDSTTTDLSIFSDGYLKITRSVPIEFGTEADVQGEEDPLASILGNSYSADSDSKWTNGCNELGHELERLMNFYRYTLNNRDQSFDAVMITGDVRRVKEIADQLSGRLGLRAEMISLDWLPSSSRLPSETKGSLSATIGLALRGLMG